MPLGPCAPESFPPCPASMATTNVLGVFALIVCVFCTSTNLAGIFFVSLSAGIMAFATGGRAFGEFFSIV